MARYGLASHVFVCADEEFVVVLDVRQDRYFTLDAARTAILAAQLPGWPGVSANTGPGVAANLALDEVAAPLLQRGWLLESSPLAKDATPAQLVPAQAELLDGSVVAGAKIGTRAVIAFVVASISAKLALRFWRFERVIRRYAERKKDSAKANLSFDPARARQLVEIFGRLRVFLFSHREKCLHDSLALLEFLARHGIFPDWVFGVRARPFVAHCWVQFEDMVLNDTVEHVGGYIPIMVV